MTRVSRTFWWIAVLCLPLLAGPGRAQPTAPAGAAEAPLNLREHYTKYEFRIPMRDGKRLFTAVYVPKDASRPYPFLVHRTPYTVAPYGVDEFPASLGPAEELARLGYIFVNQDVRGRYQSEGTFIEMTPHKTRKGPTDVDESTDMFDTVEWLLKHVPNHNGRVGLWGSSYPGFYVSASIIDGHPAIKAASPQAPITDLYRGDDTYHNGAFYLAANFGFYTSFKQQQTPTLPPKQRPRFDFGTQDGYQYYLRAGTLADLIALAAKDPASLFGDQARNDTYNDYWQSRDISRHLKNIKAAVLTVGGWYDAEDPMGPLRTFRAIGQFNPGTPNTLVMGPWAHGAWLDDDGARLGHVDFGAKTAAQFRRQVLVPFFERHLRGAGPEAGAPAAHVFETGTNVWRQVPAWPPAQATPKRLYFHAGGRLGFEPPDPSVRAGTAGGYDEYVSDPRRPVPYTPAITVGVNPAYVVGDQRFASTRPDVLVYQTEVLTEDITIAGPLRPQLFVSTSGTDSDFVVKLIDVWPDELNAANAGHKVAPAGDARDVPVPPVVLSGKQQLIRGEPFRAKFRHSFVTPSPMRPNQVETLAFEMPDILHTFRRGHRIMVHVQSSWFPLVDRNPQTFVRIPEAKASDYVKATQRLHRAGDQASFIGVGVLPGPGTGP